MEEAKRDNKRSGEIGQQNSSQELQLAATITKILIPEAAISIITYDRDCSAAGYLGFKHKSQMV